MMQASGSLEPHVHILAAPQARPAAETSPLQPVASVFGFIKRTGASAPQPTSEPSRHCGGELPWSCWGDDRLLAPLIQRAHP
jgi:hypothetical protein